MRSPRKSGKEPEAEPLPDVVARSRSRRRHPDVEALIGARIRYARISADVSQGALGEAAGITFQQVQKYENGADRIAASTLQIFAMFLGVDPGSFFESGGPMPALPHRSNSSDMNAATAIDKIRNPAVRSRLRALIAALASTLNEP